MKRSAASATVGAASAAAAAGCGAFKRASVAKTNGSGWVGFRLVKSTVVLSALTSAPPLPRPNDDPAAAARLHTLWPFRRLR